jgi:hypothetical protein
MRSNELDLHQALLNHISLIQLELDRLQNLIGTLPDSFPDELWKIHQCVSNIASNMKIDLERSEF